MPRSLATRFALAPVRAHNRRMSRAAAVLAFLAVGCSVSTLRPSGCKKNADCAASKDGPVCDTATTRCAACVTAKDCGAGKVCDRASNACVECALASDCGPAFVCVAHQCAPGCSLAHPDCGAARVCDTVHGVCVSCLADADCAGKRCDAAAHACVACLGDGDCAAGSVCRSAACVPGCGALHACPAGSVCDAGACVQCATDRDCGGATPRCDAGAHACVACLASTDNCGVGQYCVAGTSSCAPGCKEDGDCALGARCANHACVPGCDGDQRCADGQACCGGACVPLGTGSDCGACGDACSGGHGCCGRVCVPLTTVASCGACGNACGPGQDCCGGGCRRLGTDTDCGACGDACGAGAACCGGRCVATSTAQNCGACGNACAAGQACCGGGCVALGTGANCGGCGDACAPGAGCCGGLCASLSTTASCGACGDVCSVPNASPACRAGACGVGQCLSGFADCDGRPANGCEVRTDTDVANCGGCGMLCAPANATPLCVQGACLTGACAAGWGNCTGASAAGCTTALSTDVNNCGTCGHGCAIAHAVSACLAGACALASCIPGWADCNGLLDDGCEIRTDVDPANCGRCGLVCAPAHASGAACVSGACGYSQCDTGFGDCDGNAANGCETPLDTNANCGACGNACTLGFACAAGRCSAGLLSTNASWKYTATAPPAGWQAPTFDDTAWLAAVVEGTWGTYPWGAVPLANGATSTPALWIWSYDSRWSSDYLTLYFRRDFTSPAATLSVTMTADNTYRLWLDGAEVGSDADWRRTNTYSLPVAAGAHALAVVVTNQGGPGGLFVDVR